VGLFEVHGDYRAMTVMQTGVLKSLMSDWKLSIIAAEERKRGR